MNLRFPTKRLWLSALMLLAVSAPLCAAQEITPEAVKASYILKLYPFVTLGNPPHRMQKICYFEKPGVALNDSVGQIMAKYLQAHPIEHDTKLTVKSYQAIRDFSGCDVLFIPEEEDSNIDNILAVTSTSPILTISGAKRFIFRGGMIGFIIDDDNRVKMNGNLKNIKASHIAIDAQILEIMQQVIGQ